MANNSKSNTNVSNKVLDSDLSKDYCSIDLSIYYFSGCNLLQGVYSV